MYCHGWYQVAFDDELTGPLTPLDFGDRRLMAVKRDGNVRVFDAVCPHRGAHLAYGGKLDGDTVQCPFHGYHIGLGSGANGPFCVREYPCLACGGMVFIRLSSRQRPDLAEALRELEGGHTFIPGLKMQAETRIEVVIENGFDSAHFKAVHGLLKDPGLEVRPGPLGELLAEGTFEIPRWDPKARALAPVPSRSHYQGRLFSPGVFVAHLRGEAPFNYTVITTALPRGNGNACDIRLTLALPRAEGARPTDDGFARFLIDLSRDGLEKDRAIWNHLSLDSPITWTANDKAAIRFHEFCKEFAAPAP
jgi:nitrite reductase/ring-hydroxylating ferredoxin subunit